MNIVGTIEARMGSSRMPGKTLMEIYNGMCLLEVVVKRFRLSKNIDDVYVATTTEKRDNTIADWCERHEVNYYRGSEDDVLDRVVNTALHAQASAIVQMGADSAYLDFMHIDELIEIYKSGEYDYVCSDLDPTYPVGIYGHVINVSALEALNREKDLSAEEREDVARYIWEHPNLYRLKNITAPSSLSFPQLRLTVDYPEDLELAREIYSRFKTVQFTTQDLIELFKKEPWIFEKTKNLVQRSAPFLKASS